jgi:3-hydroxymyristoyl/3-hydroxydecanoyl-(acyl carrier protein) dehydratase
VFSFVDRITETEPGKRARGVFTVPAGGGEFPPSLAAEAVGQLAAWVAMAQTGFARRPVAGLAREVRAGSPVQAGTELDLEARIDTFHEDMISYDGWARAGQRVVLTLRDCVCPLLPLADFDDPESVRSRFATLVASGRLSPGVGCGLDGGDLEEVKREGTPGVYTAELAVPSSAPFFADHFPRKPVFPGSLLLEAMTRIAVHTARGTLGRDAAPVTEVAARGVKIRAFTPPGAYLALRAQSLGAVGREATVAVDVRAADPASAGGAAVGKVVASARVSVTFGEGP